MLMADFNKLRFFQPFYVFYYFFQFLSSYYVIIFLFFILHIFVVNFTAFSVRECSWFKILPSLARCRIHTASYACFSLIPPSRICERSFLTNPISNCPINDLYILNLIKMLLVIGYKYIIILNTIRRY